MHLVDSVSKIQQRDLLPLCTGGTFSSGYFITAAGVLRPGNIFKAQLSDASGMFSTPVVLGTLASITGGSIPCVLPAGVSGPGYKLRIVSTIPAMISDTVTITINPLPQPVIGISGNVLSTGTYKSYQWFKNGLLISGATARSYTVTSNGIYTVSVVTTAGCAGTSPGYTVANVAVPGLNALADVKVYPNPTNGFLTIEGAAQGTSLVISTLIGQRVTETTINTKRQTVSVNQLPAGIYILKLSDNNGGKKFIKIVKQ